MEALIFIAGIAQLAIAAGSLAIPRVLDWPAETRRLRPLTRQVFWTYAAYIWTINVAFGLLSAGAPAWLLDGSHLAHAVSGFIALYWSARVVIQFTWFDRTTAPPGMLWKLAEAALVATFAYLAVVYSVAAVRGI